MKNFINSICVICFLCPNLNAQSSENYLENHPIYNFAEMQLKSTDTIPDYSSKTNKLKLTGVIYKSDGVTPAKDVILFIEQPNEDGDFDLRKLNKQRYV
jgi:protocatechuate 3,4-dioxygenase beta subunit